MKGPRVGGSWPQLLGSEDESTERDDLRWGFVKKTRCTSKIADLEARVNRGKCGRQKCWTYDGEAYDQGRFFIEKEKRGDLIIVEFTTERFLALVNCVATEGPKASYQRDGMGRQLAEIKGKSWG